MSGGYTPSVEHVRGQYARQENYDEFFPGDLYRTPDGQVSAEEFDRMIAEVERAAREEGWEKGRIQGISDRDAATRDGAYWVVPVTENPYRVVTAATYTSQNHPVLPATESKETR